MTESEIKQPVYWARADVFRPFPIGSPEHCQGILGEFVRTTIALNHRPDTEKVGNYQLLRPIRDAAEVPPIVADFATQL